MQPKIAYLIDEASGWGSDAPDWRFYREQDVPYHRIEHADPKVVKRIVYWEVPENG